MDGWENSLGVVWDTQEPDRRAGSWLSSTARRAADTVLVESDRPEAEYWPMLLPLPPRNARRVVAVALSATTLAPFVAVAPVALAAGGVQIDFDGDTPEDQTPPEPADPGDQAQPPPADSADPQPAAPAPAATVAPAATAEPTTSVTPAEDGSADASAPAVDPTTAASPEPADTVTPAPTPTPAAQTPVASEPAAPTPTEPVPVAGTPQRILRPARRHRHRGVTRAVAAPVSTRATTAPVAAPLPARTGSIVTVHLTVGARRGPIARAGAVRTRYRVRPGDSLWRIAQDMLGPGARAARVVATMHLLWALNQRRIASREPDVLTTADVLLIPARKELR